MVTSPSGAAEPERARGGSLSFQPQTPAVFSCLFYPLLSHSGAPRLSPTPLLSLSVSPSPLLLSLFSPFSVPYLSISAFSILSHQNVLTAALLGGVKTELAAEELWRVWIQEPGWGCRVFGMGNGGVAVSGSRKSFGVWEGQL